MFFTVPFGAAGRTTCDIEFTAYDLGLSASWQDVAYCPSLGRWVVCGALGFPTFAGKVTYSDDGVTWNEASDHPTGAYNAVAGSDTTDWYFAIGGSNTGAYSSDGDSWTEFFSPGGAPNPNQLRCGAGTFMYAASLDKIYSSPSSAAGWSEVLDTTADTFTTRGIGYSADLGMWMLVGSTPTNTATDKYYYSTDGGNNWTQGTLPTSATYRGAEWNGFVWIIYAGGAGGGSDVILRSVDGVNWSDITATSDFPAGNWFSCASNAVGTMMINALGVGNGVYCSQDDGDTWTFKEMPGASSDAFQGMDTDGVSYACVVSTGADDIYVSQV